MLYDNLESNKTALVYTMLMPLRQVVLNEDWTYICESYANYFDLESIKGSIDAVAEVQDEHILVKFYFYFADWGIENSKHRLICENKENLEADVLARLPFVLKDGMDIKYLFECLEEECAGFDIKDEYGYRYRIGYIYE